MLSGPRNLVLKFTPLGGCYEWQSTLKELCEEFNLCSERKRKKKGEPVEVDSEETVEGGCSTCSLRNVDVVEDGMDCLKDMKDYHEKNFDHLERTLSAYRTRMLDGDIILRKSMLEVEGGRNVPRAMFQSTAARECSLFLHVLLQSALLDHLISILIGKEYEDKEEFLFPPLKTELQGLSRFFELYWNWPETIKDTADIVRNQMQVTSTSVALSGEESEANVIASLLLSTSNGYKQHKYLGVSFNLGLASLGLSALLISAEQGMKIGDEDNMFNLLL